MKKLITYTIAFFCAGIFSCSVQKNSDAQFYKPTYDSFKDEISDSLQSCVNFQDSVICLRNTAHSFYRCGRKSSDWEKLEYENAWKWSSERWFNLFNEDSISTKCGGATSFLASLYKEFGFTSFSITISFEDSMDYRGHSQVIVSNENECSLDLYSLYIVDPMFNFHYESDEKIQSVGQILDLLGSNSDDSLVLVSNKGSALYLQKMPIVNPFLPEIGSHSTTKVYRSKNEKSKYIVLGPRSIDRYLKGSLKRLYEKIVSQQGEKIDLNDASNFKYTILAITSFYSSCCRAEIEEAFVRKRDQVLSIRGDN